LNYINIKIQIYRGFKYKPNTMNVLYA